MPAWAIILLDIAALVAVYYFVIVPIMTHFALKRFREIHRDYTGAFQQEWRNWK